MPIQSYTRHKCDQRSRQHFPPHLPNLDDDDDDDDILRKNVRYPPSSWVTLAGGVVRFRSYHYYKDRG